MGGESSTSRRAVAVPQPKVVFYRCLPSSSKGILKTAAIAKYTEVLEGAEGDQCIT